MSNTEVGAGTEMKLESTMNGNAKSNEMTQSVHENAKSAVEKDVQILRGHIFEDLFQSGIEKDFLMDIFNSLDDWKDRTLKYMHRVGGIFDSTKREECFNDFLTVFLEKQVISELEKGDIKEMMGFITGYKNFINEIEVCGKMFSALKKLIDALPVEERTAIVDGLTGKYAVLGHLANGVLGENFAVKSKDIVSVQCAVIMFRNTTFGDVVNYTDVVRLWEPNLIQKLLKGDDKQKMLAIQLLDGNFHFKMSNEDPWTQLKPVFDELMVVLRGNSNKLKIETLKLFSKVPPEVDIAEDMNQHTFVVSVLTQVCEDITSPEGEYAKVAIEFARSRVGVTGFNGIMSALLMADSSIVGAMVIAVELDLFIINPDFVVDAFPQLVKQTRLMYTCEAVQYIAKKGTLNRELVRGISSHILLMCTSPSIVKKTEQKQAIIDTVSYFILSSAENVTIVIDVMKDIMEEIKDPQIIEEFGRSFADLKYTAADNVVSVEKLASIFCHIFTLVSDIKIIKNIMKVLAKPVSEDEPSNVVELINGVFDGESVEALKKEAESRRLKKPKNVTYEKLRMSIIAVATTGLSTDELSKISDDLLYADDVFTFAIGVEFFTAMAINYFEYTLDMLVKREFGSIDGSFLVSRKKKTRQIETIKAIFNVLPLIVKQKELDVSEQEKIWKIIDVTFPEVRYDEVVDDVIKIREVFPYIKNFVPQWSVIEKLRKPEFSKCFPIFLANVNGMDTLGMKLIRQWYKWTPHHTPEPADACGLAMLIFTLPTPDQRITAMVDALMYVVKKQMPVAEETIPYLHLVLEIVRAARSIQIMYDDDQFTEFFIYMCRFHACAIPELRTLSVSIIATLFDLVDVSKQCGAELCPGEVSGISLNLYGKLAMTVTDRFITNTLDIIIKNNKFFNYHGCLIRAIFECRDSVLTSDNVVHIHTLFSKFSGFSPFVRHHFEKGMIALADREMDDLVPIIIQSDTVFKKILLDRILKTHNLRVSFIHEYHLYMNQIPIEIKSFDTFKYIRKVMSTDPSSEIDDESYSRILSELLMWIGMVHRLAPKMNIIDYNSQISSISDTLDVIIAKTTVIEGSPNAEIAASTVKEIGKVIELICHINSQFSISKVKAAVNSCMVMLNSPNTDFVTVAAIFFIHMLVHMHKYQSAKAVKLNKKISTAIITAFERIIETETDAGELAETELRLVAACRVLPDEVFHAYHKNEILAIYNAAVEGLQRPDGTWCKHHAMIVLSRIIDLVPREKINHEELYKALVSVFDNPKFNDKYFKNLDVYLDLHQDPSLFTCRDKKTVPRLSLPGLLGIMSEREDRIIGILVKLARGKNIVDGLKQTFTQSEMAQYGLMALELSVQPYPTSVVEFLSQIAHYVKDSDDKEVVKFRQSVIRPLLTVAEDNESEIRDVAVAAVKALLLK